LLLNATLSSLWLEVQELEPITCVTWKMLDPGDTIRSLLLCQTLIYIYKCLSIFASYHF